MSCMSCLAREHSNHVYLHAMGPVSVIGHLKDRILVQLNIIIVSRNELYWGLEVVWEGVLLKGPLAHATWDVNHKPIDVDPG